MGIAVTLKICHKVVLRYHACLRSRLKVIKKQIKPAGFCSWIFETSLLAFIIADGGTVALNAPLGSGKFSSEVFGRGFKHFNIDMIAYTRDVSREI